jgi:adenylate cyclase
MFTDIVGFTALAQRDESAALALVERHNRLLRPIFSRFQGTEVKTMGDAFLVEFDSALDAVLCAVEIQKSLREAASSSQGDPEEIRLRIGIHLGDVVHSGNDILGDAVNVGSRIEPLAEPGGVCVSGPVFDQVRNKLKLPLEKLGPQDLKNVEFPVDVYRVVLSGAPSRPPPAGTEGEKNLRLAVLPLANLSADPSDEYFADGLTDELISQVSRVPSLRVIARTSVLRYKGSSQSIREVARDLGVRLALEGSVRKAGNRVRINVHLVDTKSEEHLWSSRYDRPLDDIFSIQDDIAGQIAQSISGHLFPLGVPTVLPFVRGSPVTQDMEAYTNFLHGRRLLSEKGSETTIRQALEFFEAAVRRDPLFARARVGIAECLIWLSDEGASPYLSSVERAREELETALERDEGLAEAHSVRAGLLLGGDDMQGAEREARRAMELNPSLCDAYRWLAQIEAGRGRIDETVRLLEAALRLDPVDVNVLAFLGRAYAYAGREPEALAHWARTKSLVPFRTNAHLTEYYLGRGDYAKAKECLREMERIRPESRWTEMYRAFLAARSGDTEAARRAIDRFTTQAEQGEMTVFFTGFIHYALGEMDAFVACLERAFELHSLPYLELRYSRLFELARQDPRVVDLIRRQEEFHPR